MSVSLAQESFTGGEWAPALHSRSSHAKYGTACAKLLNFIPLPHGGAQSRPGFEYIASTKDHSRKARLRRFQFNTEQGYILEFGHQYIRFYFQGAGQITSTKSVTGAVNNGSGLIRLTVTAHGFATGNTVTVASVGGVPNATGTWIITVIDPNTIDLQASTFAGTYTSGGTAVAIVEVASPYSESDLALLNFEQSNDVLYIAHTSHAPRKLTRTSHYAWTLSTITFGAGIASPGSPAIGGAGKTFGVTAVSEDGIESVPAEDEGDYGNTFTWSAVTGAVEYKVYRKVDGLWQFIARTGSGTTSYAVPASPTLDPDISPPLPKNPFGSSNNYPGAVGFWKQRLGWAGTNNDPQKFWLSVGSDFENLNVSSPVQDNDAISKTLDGGGQVNRIKWIAELKFLAIGTAGAEFRVFSDGAVTPSAIDAEVESDWGSADIQPIRIGKSLLFVDSTRAIVRDMFYTFDAEGDDGYAGNDLTILSAHLFSDSNGIKEWCYEKGQNSLIWTARDDGKFPALTYHKEHVIYGWHVHETDGVVESIESIRTPNGTSEVWAIIKRTINGATKRYVERLHDRDFEDIEDAFCLDSGLTYVNSIATTLALGTGADVQGTENVLFTAGSGVFVSGDEGRFIHHRYYHEKEDENDELETGYYTAIIEITSYVSATQVRGLVRLPFPSLTTIESGKWRMSVKTVTGLSHLEGKKVTVLADGSIVDGLTVSSGSITLEDPASKVHIGLPYDCDLETLDFVYQARNGTVQDRVRSIPSVVLALSKTRGCFVGPDEDHLREVHFRTTERYGEPTRLFTGLTKDKAIDPGKQERSSRIFIRGVPGLPITVQAIYPRVVHGNS